MNDLSGWLDVIEKASDRSEANRLERLAEFRKQTAALDCSVYSNEELLQLFVKATNGTSSYAADERRVWRIALKKIKAELFYRFK